jgi:phosphatidylglycerophosphate synthase
MSEADRAVAPLARRDLQSLTAQAEKRLLVSMAERLPAWVTPDGLTALGVAGMAGAGLCYWLVPATPPALLGVNACLVLNWLGDSLDGTLARVRRRERPRYGFYLDHLVDGLGAVLVMAGLAASGLVRPGLALAGLVAYLLLQVHIALKAHATGVFQIAFGRIGGTELRMLVILLNTIAFARLPGVASSGLGLFDAAVGTAVGLLTVTLLRDAFATARRLDRAERAAWKQDEAMG